MEKLKGHKRSLFLSAVMVALGITFTTIMKDTLGLVGIVFIAVGGFFFIVGMSKKRKEDEENNK
jgi:predicted membrane channel-forming protein YqfA (hemolysin III family)